MKLKTLPAESAVQLLTHMAEHPALPRFLEGLESSISPTDLKRLLLEIVSIVRDTSEKSEPATISSFNVRNDPLLSEKTKALLSCLSPKEEKKLLARFGLLES